MIAAAVATAAFVAVEALAGYLVHSLALLADAGHNVTDVLALLLSLYGVWIAGKPATTTKTYGYHRVGILAAIVNSATLFLIAGGIIVEAIRRLHHPSPIEGGPMFLVAIVAVAVNTITALWLRRPAQDDLTVRSAFIHLAADAFGTLGVVIASLGIMLTGMTLLDPLVSLLLAGGIAWSGTAVLREAINILLEGVPPGVDPLRLARSIQSIPGVLGVHDLHVWSLTSGVNSMSCHVTLDDMPMSQASAVVSQISAMVSADYNIRHATIQVECTDCALSDLFCDMSQPELTATAQHADRPRNA